MRCIHSTNQTLLIMKIHENCLKQERQHVIDRLPDEDNTPASLRIYFKCISYKFMLSSFFVLLIFFAAHAQQIKKLSGTVSDDKGQPLSGVSVTIKGATSGTATDESGKFSISAKSSDVLVFTMISYTTSEITVGNQVVINVSLVSSASALSDVVVVGYGTQKRANLTNSVSSIKSADIVTTKNENILNSLSGKVPGLRIVQNSSEPGSFSNSFDVRGLSANGGSPALLVIDGIPRSDISRVDPNDVESISVLKDASAAVYGVRAANGVILITTKKGKKGSIELNYTGSYGWQVPIRLSKPVGIVDWMTLVNEKSIHNAGTGFMGNTVYTPEEIAEYANGTKKGTDWYDAVMKKSAAQTQHNFSASGGSDRISYYASLGYTSQDGIFKSNDLNYKRYNIRSNITAKVTNNLTLDVNLTGIMDEKGQPYISPWYVFRSLWYQPPIYSIYANDNPGYLNNPLGGLSPVAHSYAGINGYQNLNNKWFQSSASLTYNIPGVQGLSVKGLYSYDYNTNDNKKYQNAYNLYTYDASTDKYNAAPQQTPGTMRKEFYEYSQSLAQLSLNYNHSFGNSHNIGGLLVYEASDRTGDNLYAQRELSLAIDQLFAGNSTNQQGNSSSDINTLYKFSTSALVGRFNYNYKSKYFAEFSFREDGSSRFGEGKRWGFFPAGSAGWRISQEKFWRNAEKLSFINEFKIRSSYGITGDDNTKTVYGFLTGYTYPSGGSVFDNTFVNAVKDKGLANANFTWYTSKMFDIGADLEAWKGLLGVTFAYFERNRSGLPSTQVLAMPDVVGATLPEQNLNSDRTRGFDLEVSHKNVIGKFGYNVRGMFSATRTMWVNNVRAKAGNSYLNWKNNLTNRYIDIYWGYGSGGQFESYNAIANSPIYVNKATVVGDYRYEDWNGDGQIGADDSYPIARKGMPLITYGFNIACNYTGFDLNLLFQGAGRVNAAYLEQLNTPLWAGGNALTQFLDRWHPENPTADPYDPNTKWVSGNFAYTGTVPYTNTLSNLHSAAYLRLKSIELGYTFSNKWLQKTGIKSARLYANGYNLLTFTKLKYIDPEHPSETSSINSNYGYFYPNDKIYTFGLNLKF